MAEGAATANGAGIETPAESGGRAIRLSPIDGPPLTKLETKIADPRWLIERLMKPHRLSPGRIMPDFVLPRREAETVARYLYGDRPAPRAGSRWKGGNARVGARLFVSRGCRGCHGIVPNDTSISARVPNLAGIGIKARGDWLFDWLKSPRSYNPETAMPRLGLRDGETRHLVAFLLTRKDGADVLATAPRLTRRANEKAGRHLIERYGCTSCHEVRGFRPPAPGFKVEAERAGLPRDIVLQTGRVLISQYNCRGCHRIEGNGGAIAEHLERRAFAPPTLDGEGLRVQTSWVVRFLQRPKPLRPWLHIRMPDYGLSEVQARALAAYFAALAGVSMADEPHEPFTEEIVRSGRRRFVHHHCTQCHPTSLNAELPKGVDLEDLSIDLVLAKTRLRPSWIRDFLARPKEIAGMETRMPTVFYTVDGIPKVEHPEQEIEAITAYLLQMNGAPEVAAAESEKRQTEEKY